MLCCCFIAKPKSETSDSKKEALRQLIRAEGLVDYVARRTADQGGLKQEFEVSSISLGTIASDIDL